MLRCSAPLMGTENYLLLMFEKEKDTPFPTISVYPLFFKSSVMPYYFIEPRKNSSALKTGKLMQYLPQDGLYVYFRYNDQQTIMCVMNASPDAKTVDFSRYGERIKGYTKAMSVSGDGISFSTRDKSQINSYDMWVLELMP